MVAGDTVYVAEVGAHRLVALDAQSGKPRWSFFAGGRIDSPPTIAAGRCLVAARDGWLYCLRVDDGSLAWRLRVAPSDWRIASYGQLESLWPAHGSVLVRDKVVYVTAGRSAAVDGGLSAVAARIDTGQLVWRRRITGQLINDLLVDDEKLYLREQRIDPASGKPSLAARLIVNARNRRFQDNFWAKNELLRGMQTANSL